MKYLKEFKATEIDRWKKFPDFGDEGISTDKKAEEIIIVGGFPEDVIKGGDDQKPMTDEEIDDLYSAMVDDVKNNEEEEDKDDEQIDPDLRKESKIFNFESFDEIYRLDEKKKSGVSKTLKNKSDASGIPVGILRKVFSRGMRAWNSGHRPGVAQHGWAIGRVNSFITGEGGARKADAELWTKAKAAKAKKKK